jgi:Fibronectin type III domain
VNSQLRTPDSGGDPAPSANCTTRPLPPRRRSGLLRAISPAALAFLFAACGVQAPPEPPRVEIPQQVKDLATEQVGRTLHISFTMPTLATDDELLSKRVLVDIFRNVSPAGRQSAPPDASGKPWMSLSPKELSNYTRAGRVDYPLQLSPQDFQQQVGSTFAFLVVGLTRGFRGHPRRSVPSNIAQATLLDVAAPVGTLVVKPTQDALLLTWDKPGEMLTGVPPSHISGYRVYQSASGKPGSFDLLGEAVSNHFENKNFEFGRQYFFLVRAVTALGKETAESEPSAPVSITPRDVFSPPVPRDLTVVNTPGAVDLLWNASSANDLAGYNVYRSAGGGPFERINKELAPTPIFHDATVSPGQDYEYAVTAVDLTGNESERSTPASVTTPPSVGQ